MPDDPLARDRRTNAEIASRLADDPEIAALRKRRDQLTARLERLSNVRSTRERKRRTRRLILLGSYVEREMLADPEFAQRIRFDLDLFLTRKGDRALFNLPPGPPA